MELKDLQAMMNMENKCECKRKLTEMLMVKICSLVVVGAAGMAIGICIASNHKDKIDKLKDKATNTAEDIKDVAQKGAKMASEKTEKMKEEIKGGYHEIKKDIHETVEGISEDLKTYL